MLHSGAGKILEDIGEYDSAFERYHACRADKDVGEFDLEDLRTAPRRR